ncbi:phosphohydrolase [Secundilactobacillus oryzae JCM 18671]|uniref:Phosphohydrolase n=1 Tax=Secundilactobacillus oryzae JCM 18671 TaxID=1291743 RepID=A0A081BL48_9LACO|nr:phosphohydrolase [Secundilactobacillus oryzae JCM 18671]
MAYLETDAQLEAVRQFTKERMADDETGHGFDHIQRVVNNVKLLLARETGANQLVTISAAYLHDVTDDKLVEDVTAATNELKSFLTNTGFDDDQIDEIVFVIENMSFSKSLNGGTPKALPIEGQLVQDADRLDAIGAIGIARAIYFGGHFGEKIYDPEIAPREVMTKADYRDLSNETIINHFYEKLLKLKDRMNTKAAKEIAAGRQQTMLQFLDDFKAEWQGTK